MNGPDSIVTREKRSWPHRLRALLEVLLLAGVFSSFLASLPFSLQGSGREILLKEVPVIAGFVLLEALITLLLMAESPLHNDVQRVKEIFAFMLLAIYLHRQEVALVVHGHATMEDQIVITPQAGGPHHTLMLFPLDLLACFAAAFLFVNTMSVRKRYVTTLLGRRLQLPDLQSPNAAQRAFAERVAVNAPIQGSAADLVKVAMVRLDAALRESGMAARLILQVHDELLLEVPTGEVEPLRELVRREMEGAFELRVPILVEVGVGRSWAEAH